MTNPAIARFQARRRIQSKLASRPRLSVVPVAEKDDRSGSIQFDQERIDHLLGVNSFHWDRSVPPAVIEARLGELAIQSDQSRTQAMWRGLRHDVLHSIATPFGIGKVLSALDKVGGNVDTVRNVRKGVYATEKERERFHNRPDYDSNAHHNHPNYVAKGRENLAKLKEGALVDDHTGKVVHLSAKGNSRTKPTIDHEIAAKIVDGDPGRTLAEINAADLSNRGSNLKTTSASINSAKNSKTAEEFLNYLEETRPARQVRIRELEAKGTELSDRERAQLAKLTEQEKVDPARVRESDRIAREEMDRVINWTYYPSWKFAGAAVKTSATEGIKMGAQQAFGTVLVEFFAGVFDEITDWSQKRGSEETLMKEVKARLRRVARRCEAKLKEALAVFQQGFVAGFFSNLVTTLINAAITTGKRVVRMLREGIGSLVRGAKTLLCRPEGMSFQEGAHEASKVLLAGTIIVGAIPIEEWLEKQLLLLPWLAGIAQIITAIIVGSTTAVVTAFAVYLLDKADPFNVIKDQRNQEIHSGLDASIIGRECCIEELLMEDHARRPVAGT